MLTVGENRPRYIPVTLQFIATYSDILTGYYIFNQSIKLIDIQPNNIYTIDTMQINANVPENDYQKAIVDLVKLRCYRSITSEPVFNGDIPVVRYKKNSSNICYEPMADDAA